jgi:hypothetical protein
MERLVSKKGGIWYKCPNCGWHFYSATETHEARDKLMPLPLFKILGLDTK